MTISQRYILDGGAYHRVIEIRGLTVVGTACGLIRNVGSKFSEAVRFQKELEREVKRPNYCQHCAAQPAEVAA